MITIEKLCVRYPDGTDAIHNISFTIQQEQTVGLIGANGAGKSTLLRTMLGLLPKNSGSIKINGLEVEKTNLPDIRMQMGMVFQNSDDQLFMTSVFEDIAFAPRNYGMPEDLVEKRVDAVLQQLGSPHLKHKIPNKLSGGEKRIAAIGTVLSTDPSILLLDEPTSFLDPKSRRRVMGVLESLPIIKLIATHDLDMALELCQRVIVLKEGKVFADGDAKTILKDKDMLEACGLELPFCLQQEGLR